MVPVPGKIILDIKKTGIMNKVKRYIPEKVYETIKALDFKNKEHLYVVCDMIYRSSIYKKEDKDYSNQYVDIPHYYFRDLIQKQSTLKEAQEFLYQNGIIKCDNKYSIIRGKALGYKFSDEYVSKLISVDIKKKTISGRIIKNKNERNNLVNEDLKLYRDYYLSTFKIDYEKSLEYLNNWFNISISLLTPSYEVTFLDKEWIKLVNQYNHIFISINAINDGDLYFRKNTTNGRIDTNLTSLKSEYKKFIVSDKDLYQIDIINSQPFILYLYLNSLLREVKLNQNEKKELDMYGDWTSSGLFYEMFERTYFNKTGKTLTRKEIKYIMFCIFYSKNGSYKKEKDIFKSILPKIMKWIEDEKQTKHNEFAIKLQKIESKICIDKICKELDKQEIQYYTIHDAWLVDKSDINKLTKIVYSMFYKYLNRRPELKIEKIK
jgi:hypothetical protein